MEELQPWDVIDFVDTPEVDEVYVNGQVHHVLR